MQSANVQHPGRRRWTIGRLMLIIAMIGLVFGLARAIGWGWVPLLVVLAVFGLATAFGIRWDRRTGGLGILGAVLGGIVAGSGVVSLIALLLVVSEPGAFDLGGFLFSLLLYGAGFGGISGLIVGGLVAIALILSGIDSGIQPPSTIPSGSSPGVREAREQRNRGVEAEETARRPGSGDVHC